VFDFPSTITLTDHYEILKLNAFVHFYLSLNYISTHPWKSFSSSASYK